MKTFKKRLPVFFCLILFIGLMISPVTAEAKAVKLANTKLTVTEGKSKQLKLNHNKKSVTWSITSGKKYVQLKKKSKTGVQIVGKKAGKAVVRAKIGKKSYTCKVTVKKAKKGKTTPITLTVGNTILNGYLYDSVPAKSLISQLPLTVELDDSGNDFCGGDLDIKYSKSDVQYGYKNGDLAFWTPANNFVIFVDDEEKSAGIGDLVILGRLTEPQKVLDSLKGTLRVRIELAHKK